MAFTTEELRSLLFDYLKGAKANNPRLQPQFNKCIQGVAHQYGIRAKKEAEHQRGEMFLDASDISRLKQVVWDLILERVMVPGSAQNDKDGWPWLTVTDHGWKVVNNAGPIPNDPDGYLSRVAADSPSLHPTAFRYLQEALATFKTGNQLASSVMLGAASERVFVDVAESIGQAIADPAKRNSFEKSVSTGKMVQRVKALVGWSRNHKSQLCGDWQRDERVEVIDHLAHFIRKRRNDAGHPQDPPAVPSHEEMYSWLVVFPDYCKALYELKTYLNARPSAII